MTAQAGDLVICHSRGILGKAIRWAQRRLPDKRYSKWNHVAVLNKVVDGQWTIIQAQTKGVTDTMTLDKLYQRSDYEIVEIPEYVDRALELDFLRSQVGQEYGWLSIVSCAFDMVLPDKVSVRSSGTWICSALAGAALWYGGFEPAQKWPDLYTLTPAELAQACLGEASPSTGPAS